MAVRARGRLAPVAIRISSRSPSPIRGNAGGRSRAHSPIGSRRVCRPALAGMEDLIVHRRRGVSDGGWPTSTTPAEADTSLADHTAIEPGSRRTM